MPGLSAAKIETRFMDLVFCLLLKLQRAAMERQKVDSSVLKSVGYNKVLKLLETELVNDSLYEYYKVPEKEYNNLMKAESLGEYYNKCIKKYRYKKLR